MSDSDLVLAYQRGMRLAFRELVRRYLGTVLSVFKQLGLCETSSEQAARLVFQDFAARAGEFRHEALFHDWLMTLVVSRWSEFSLEPNSCPVGLATLNDREKLAITLRYRSGVTHDPLAEMLGITPGELRMTLRKALEKIACQSESENEH